MEDDFRHRAIGGKAPEKPVEPVPAADIGDAEEMEVIPGVRGGLSSRNRGNIEAISYGDMRFFGIIGAGHFVLCNLVCDTDDCICMFSYCPAKQKVD